MINVLVVDDEPLARQRLTRLLGKITGYKVVSEANNGEQAIVAVNEWRPDIVLMDIRMPLMDGLVAARALSGLDEPPAVIFCTAYNDYALEAFEANAVGYLLKPVNQDKLEEALLKAQRLNRLQLTHLIESGEEGREPRSCVSARTSRGIELVPVKDIRYFLADQKYVTVYFEREGVVADVLIDDTLKELEDEFGQRFVRLHRNALVAIDHITGVSKTEQGFKVGLEGVEDGPMVSRRHMPELRKLIKQL